MRKKIVFALFIVVTVFLLSNCSNTKNAVTTPTLPSLKETFKNDFLIGTALSKEHIEEKDSGAAKLVPQQFNAVTPENIMKAEIIHPQWDEYNFSLSDKLIEYAKKNDLEVTAIPLVWHSQVLQSSRHQIIISVFAKPLPYKLCSAAVSFPCFLTDKF